MVDDAIGIFDSGVGGLSIWKEIVRRLPWENTIYVADKLHFPYGEKTDQQIRNRATKIVAFLINRGCAVIVLACNSATVAALPYLRKRFPITFVGVEPAVKPATKETETGEITVLATTKTTKSQRQRILTEIYGKGTLVHVIAAPTLVRAVEEGRVNSETTLKHLKTLLKKETIGRSDRIVLGCTHFPFLIPSIRKSTGKNIKIIEPSKPVARRLWEIRRQVKGSRKKIGKHEFFTTKDKRSFQRIAEKLIGPLPGPTKQINL